MVPPYAPSHALYAAIASALAIGTWSQTSLATPIAVMNCNDSGSGSLRSAIAASNVQDSSNAITLDTSQMACSTITLTSGELVVPQPNLLVQTISTDGPVTISGNFSSSHHARVFNHQGNGTLTLQNLTIEEAGYGNAFATYFSGSGGCITSQGTVDLESATVTNCQLAADDNPSSSFYSLEGGAIFAQGGIVMNRSVVSNSSVVNYYTGASNMVKGILAGGGISTNGPIQLSYSTVENNLVNGPVLCGAGGIYAHPTSSNQSSIIQSTISSNTACGTGGIITGGMDFYSGSASSVLMIVNSTFSDNGGGITFEGGNIYNGLLSIANSTISDRLAVVLDMNADIAINSSLVNSIYSYKGTLVNGANNVIGSNNTEVTFQHQPIVADPMLLPLMSNGGPTKTRALSAGSVAIAHGENTMGLATDQRGEGFPRSANGVTDAGAYQWSVADRIFANGFQ